MEEQTPYSRNLQTIRTKGLPMIPQKEQQIDSTMWFLANFFEHANKQAAINYEKSEGIVVVNVLQSHDLEFIEKKVAYFRLFNIINRRLTIEIKEFSK